MGLGTRWFTLEMSMVSFFKEGEPVKLAYDRFRAIFGGDEVVYIVYEAKDGNVFSEDSLRAVHGIQEELLNYRLNLENPEESHLDRITDVNTLVNASYLETRGGTLISREFIGSSFPATEEEVRRLQEEALTQEDYPRLYFSEDFRYGGILIKTDFNAVPEGIDADGAGDISEASVDDVQVMDLEAVQEEEMPDIYSDDYLPKFKKTRINEYVPFMKEIWSILNKPEYSDHLTFHPVGNPPLMSYAFKNMMYEMGMIMLGCLLLIVAMLWLLFRSFSAVIWPVLIVMLTLLWTMGTIGWSGLAMTEMYNVIVFLIFAVGVADAIHILSGYLFFRNKKLDHKTAIRTVFRKSGPACFLTSITTSLGLLSMVFVPIVPLQRFAVFAAIGVIYAFIITVFLLPLMLDIWSPVSRKRAARIEQSKEGEHLIQGFIRRFDHLFHQVPYKIIAVFSVASIVLAYGALNIRVESNSIENLKEDVPLKATYKLVDRYMGGTGNLEVLIDSGEINGMKKPEMLNAVEELQQYVEQEFSDIVIKTVSLVNVTKNSYKALNEGNPEMYKIPQDPKTLIQTLFMFDSANPEDRRQLVSDDYRMAHIRISSKNIGSIKGLEVMNAVDSYIRKNLSPLKATFPDLKVTTTGQLPLQLKLMDYISWSQVQSFGIAVVSISIVLLLVMGSVKIGVVAIIPNILPIITAFGVMGYFDMALDVHTLLVVPIIIGIAVDDTIHFLTHYRIEMQHHGNVKEAILIAYREAGQAIVFTSLVLAFGFLVFLFSSNKGFSYFGILSAVSIFTATVADLILLPALLYLVDRNTSVESETEPPELNRLSNP